MLCRRSARGDNNMDNQVFIDALQRQYNKSLFILTDVIKRYDSELWKNEADYKSPTWQIVYHLLFYTNIYASPSENMITKWNKERTNYHRFDKMHETRKTSTTEISQYTKDEMLEYVNFIENQIPMYLEKIEPTVKCWPNWYDENQMEFQMNNLRHMQHHIGEIIERHDIKSIFEYKWK
jgi:hypothetical protein